MSYGEFYTLPWSVRGVGVCESAADGVRILPVTMALVMGALEVVKWSKA